MTTCYIRKEVAVAACRPITLSSHTQPDTCSAPTHADPRPTEMTLTDRIQRESTAEISNVSSLARGLLERRPDRPVGRWSVVQTDQGRSLIYYYVDLFL